MMLELWLEDARSYDFAMNERGEKIPKNLLNKLLRAEEIGRWFYERHILLVKAKYSVSRPCVFQDLST
jgi:hypothetical protein